MPRRRDPNWLTPTVQSIAAAIYEDRTFDRLPILADALEEAGCTNADVLLHCRRPGEHVRGCWVVDLVLGEGVRPSESQPYSDGRFHRSQSIGR